MSNLVELLLKKQKDESDQLYNLDKIIEGNQLSVILGVPGSGKTSILTKYSQENGEFSSLMTVKDFIRLDKKIPSATQVLFLDGLDEYRVVTTDKEYVVKELSNKLSKLIGDHNRLKIVITCREMDWYGDVDQSSLKDEIGCESSLYYLMPLNYQQKLEMAKILSVDDEDEFIISFDNLGFLSNPQLFYLASETWKENQSVIKSKFSLYNKFISSSKKDKKAHTQVTEEPDTIEFLRVIGYLGFFYIFCGIDSFSEEVIDQIADETNGYSHVKIEQVLKTKLFIKRKFIHRTVAEFALAKYICEEKLSNAQLIGKERVKGLFVKHNKIPTALRGTYAWLCCIRKNRSFINIDPYYQLINGDSSLFDSEAKKEIIQAIKVYAETNPYFLPFDRAMELELFYEEDLDDILINEFTEGVKLKSHYIHFIIRIIAQNSMRLSEKIKGFAKCQIKGTIKSGYKKEFIQLFKNDPEFLRELIIEIKNGVLEDDSDCLKDKILGYLYPEYITHNEISEFLWLYSNHVIGYCLYLYNTEYEDKYDLVTMLYKKFDDESDNDINSFKRKRVPLVSSNAEYRLPINAESFVEDYFLETILKFPDELTAENIYVLIKHFKGFYKQYNSLNFQSYRDVITDKLKESQGNFQLLANELYRLYIQDLLQKESKFNELYEFEYFFNYKKPNNKSGVLLDAMNESSAREGKLALLQQAFCHLPVDDNGKRIIDDKIHSIVKKYKFENVLESLVNPPIPHLKTWEEERLEELDLVISKNEAHFKDKKDEDIIADFGDLSRIANIFYLNDKPFHQNLTEATEQRLKQILKSLVFKDLLDIELLTLKSLAAHSPNARRNIDTVYYTSLALNEANEVLEKSGNNKFSEYLYINSLHHKNVMNVIKSDFVDKFESLDQVVTKNILKEYITYIISRFEELSIFNSHLAKEDSLEDLKLIARFISSLDMKNAILEKLLIVYGYLLSCEELDSLKLISDLDINNKTSIEALACFGDENLSDFSLDMAKSFYRLLNGEGRESELITRFNKLGSKKVNAIHFMISVFNTEELLEQPNGWQSDENICASFLTRGALNLLNESEIEQLSRKHIDKDDIWRNRILDLLYQKQHESIDRQCSHYSIPEIKSFILKNSILSNQDFFEEICFRLEELKSVTEDNRNNDKKKFYNSSNSNGLIAKNEEECRDIIYQLLDYKYKDELNMTRESYEANNRVDINIKYKPLSAPSAQYEVQIECKKDSNGDIYNGIESQLINKYFSSGVQYGVYLIFYFAQKIKDTEEMLNKLEESIPLKYKDNIKVICIELKL